MRTQAWYERQERVDYVQTSAALTLWKQQEDLQFLNEVSSVPLQQGLRHLQKGFANFFDGRTRYPRFKKKHNGGSAKFTKSAFKYRDGQLYLAKCVQPLPIVWSRALPEGVDPSNYDGTDVSFGCREVSKAWMDDDQLQALAAFLLRSAQVAPNWGQAQLERGG